MRKVRTKRRGRIIEIRESIQNTRQLENETRVRMREIQESGIQDRWRMREK
jgi:hypothetical protein